MTTVWPEVTLDEVAQFLDSQRRPITGQDRKKGNTPYYGANGVQDYVDGFLFDEPLVLLAEDGGHFDDPQRGIAYGITGKSWVNNHAHVLRPKDGVDFRFLVRVLEHYDVRQFITGTTRAKLTKAGASRITFLLPPLDEQRRIAAILDKADEVRAMRLVALETLGTLGQAVFVDMFGDPLTNSMHLPTAQLGDHTAFIRGVTFKPEDVCSLGEPGSVTCMRTKNVQATLDLEDVWAIPERFVRKPDQYLREGDLLVSSANSWNLVGKCSWVGSLPWPSTFGGFVTVLRVDSEELDPRYLYSWFSSPSVQATLRSFGRRTTSISNLSLNQCRQLPLPLPPKVQQAEFAHRMENLQSVKDLHQVDSIELDGLFSSVQQRAFQGAL